MIKLNIFYLLIVLNLTCDIKTYHKQLPNTMLQVTKSIVNVDSR